MSVDISIKQKGFFKKELPLNVILGHHLKYGVLDGLRLEVGVLDENDFIVYNPQHIGRGISVCIDRSKTKNVSLRLLSPTSNEELHDFYECVERIANYWKCTLEVDGTVMSVAAFKDGFANMCDFNSRTLKNMATEIIDEDTGNLTLFSVFWPLVIGKNEAVDFIGDNSVDVFGNWLHEKNQ